MIYNNQNILLEKDKFNMVKNLDDNHSSLIKYDNKIGIDNKNIDIRSNIYGGNPNPKSNEPKINIAQGVFNELYDIVPRDFDKIAFFVVYFKEDKYRMEYYFKRKNGQYIYCYDILNEYRLAELFRSIHRDTLYKDRSRLKGDLLWYAYSLIITDEGKRVDASSKYIYSPISESDYRAVRDGWVRQFLV